VGETIGVTWRVRVAGRLVDVGQVAVPLRADCTINLRLGGFRVAKKGSYAVTFELNDINGEKLTRRVTIRGS
jgi:hypothetical protein